MNMNTNRKFQVEKDESEILQLTEKRGSISSPQNKSFTEDNQSTKFFIINLLINFDTVQFIFVRLLNFKKSKLKPGPIVPLY